MRIERAVHLLWLPGLLACASIGCVKGTRNSDQAESPIAGTDDPTAVLEQSAKKTPTATGTPTVTSPTATRTDGGLATTADGGTSPSDAGTVGVPSSGPDAGTSTTAASCGASAILSKLGKTRLLVGASMDDTAASAAPWDMRYLYLAGGIPDSQSSCTTCGACTSGGTTCANSGSGCAWWGCWQDDQLAPGDYLRTFVSKAQSRSQLPVITYYEFLDMSGLSEGAGQLAAATNVSKMQRYFNDWRTALQQVGANRALLHIEPDLWGYAQGLNSNPSAIPAAVASANSVDCAALPNTFAGFGQCMVLMAKKYAPNALVGVHASAWATGVDAMQNRDGALNVSTLAQQTADFLTASGGAQADFITVELSDRDAGWYELQGQSRWFDATNATLPNFHQAFTWAKALSTRAGKPLLYWQLPVGNANLANTFQHYRDNRVDYLMSHLSEVAATNAFGVLFGAGLDHQTNPSTDNGNLISKVKAYAQTAGQAVCPTP